MCILRIAVAALIIGGLFNVLVVHYGSTVFITLPDSIPIIGGILTLEALVFGVLNALRVISIIFAFATFSRLINYADLLRLTPSALFELGLMLSIGVTLVPFILRSWQRDLASSQALRGHRAKGIRGLLPLFHATRRQWHGTCSRVSRIDGSTWLRCGCKVERRVLSRASLSRC